MSFGFAPVSQVRKKLQEFCQSCKQKKLQSLTFFAFVIFPVSSNILIES